MSDSVTKGLVSVIIPSYNYASYLEKRIESILSQTYSDIEIIVIDDCSPDNSVEVLQKYVTHSKVTLVLKEENSGWISTNNQGVELAKGEYILFAQCDDLCEPTMIEKLVGAMQRNTSIGLSFCRSMLIDEHGKHLGEDYEMQEKSFKLRCKKGALLHKKEASIFFLQSCVIPNLSAVLIRKCVFDVVGEFPKDYPACADWAWFLSVAEHYDMAYVSEPLNYFMQHDETIRSLTKERVLYEEYFRLLLSNEKKLELSFVERSKARYRVMELWCQHLVKPSLNGIVNFPYHFAKIVGLDVTSLLYFPFALIVRILALLGKIMKLKSV